MHQQIKLKKPMKMVQNTTDIYLQNRTRNTRYNISTNQNKNDLESIRSFTRKSIQNSHTQSISNPYAQTINQPQRHYYKRVSNNFRRQLGQRYEQQDSKMSKSPYMKQSLGSRTSSLNRSSNKIKSSHLVKQISQSPNLYKQPRSSLSHHYQPEQSNSHKRRSSIAPTDDHKNYVIQQAKQLFKNNQFIKSIQLLKKFTRIYGNHVEGKYFLGMSYINNNQFSLGIQELLQTLNIHPKFKKSLYLVLALAYKKINKIQQAIQILTQGFQHFPQYYDCIVYRGKLYIKLNKYLQAINDFNVAIEINDTKAFAYLGKGTAQQSLKKVDEAIKTFTQGLTKSDDKVSFLQKRGKCYYQIKNYQKALADFEACTNIDRNYPHVHYLKGYIYYKLGKPTEAILCFEQCLKFDTDKDNLTSSVETMIKIKIQDKDFYEAYHILGRAQNIDVNKTVIQDWRMLLQASLYLMKKKCKEGIDGFKNLLNNSLFKRKYQQLTVNQKQRYEFIKPLIHLYKAFGQLTLNNIQAAKVQYKQYDEVCSMLKLSNQNLSKKYNSLIIAALQNFPKNALLYLQQANQLLPVKPQPYLYLTFDRITKGKKNNEIFITKQSIEYIIKNLSKGIQNLPQLSNNHISSFYYYRSVIYLYNNQFKLAISDIDKAIEKSQDNIPKYFYLRGSIFACYGNFGQAIQDLSVAINLDERFAKAYLERAKCLQIDGNSNQAFLDLQKYITLAPDDLYIHKYAGFLLFQNCAYEDCLSAFNHGQQTDNQITLTRAKCYFLLGNFQMSIELFKKYNNDTNSNQFQLDILMIQYCTMMNKNASTIEKLQELSTKVTKILQQEKNQTQNDIGKIFKLRDIYQFQSCISLILGRYDRAIEQLEKCLDLFQQQKQRELQKQFVGDVQQFEDQWSQIQIRYNISLCYLAKKDYQRAYQQIMEFENSQQKGKNWQKYTKLLRQLLSKKEPSLQLQSLDIFEQNHRLSKNFSKLKISDLNIEITLAYSYPFVEPPQLIPEFDQNIFKQFDMKLIDNKPQAPWINRSNSGLIFTPNVQIFQNLQLSMATSKKQQTDHNRPNSNLQNSIELSHEDIYLEADALKEKFKLDSMVEMKLKRLMKKNNE